MAYRFVTSLRFPLVVTSGNRTQLRSKHTRLVPSGHTLLRTYESDTQFETELV
jgi:hypothetical protein